MARPPTSGAVLDSTRQADERQYGIDTNTRSSDIAEKNPSEIPFPEGGWQAWATVLGVFIVQFCTFGYTNAFGVYQDFYVRIYLTDKSSSQISWIGSVQLFLILTMGIFTGRAFDRGYYYHLMIGGIILYSFSLVMLSLSLPNHYYQVFLSHGLGVGIGLGMTYIPSMSLISHHFQRRRTLALGIASSGSSLGGIIHPIMLNRLFHGSVGFQKGVRASAVLTFGLLVLAMILMRPRLPPAKPRSLLPKLRAFARDLPYVFVVVGASLVLLGLYFPVFFLQLDAIKHGIDPHFTFYTVAIMNGANLLGRILPNVVAHHFGVLNIMVPSTAVCAILIFAILAVCNIAGVVVFAVLFGFFSGAYVSLLPPTVATLSDDIGEIGARLGICLGITGFAGLVGSPIAGELLSSNFVWWRPVVFAGVCVTLGTVALAVARFLYLARKRQRSETNLKPVFFQRTSLN